MRPHMVFVPIKNEEQQGVLMLHRTRDLLVRQRTMLVNAMRAHLAEFGIVAAQGRRKVKDLITGLDNAEVPELARIALWQIADQIDECDKHVDALERRILACHRTNEASRNLSPGEHRPDEAEHMTAPDHVADHSIFSRCRRCLPVRRRSGSRSNPCRARSSSALAAGARCRSNPQADRRGQQGSRAGRATSSRSDPSGWLRRQSRQSPARRPPSASPRRGTADRRRSRPRSRPAGRIPIGAADRPTDGDRSCRCARRLAYEHLRRSGPARHPARDRVTTRHRR